MDISNQPLTKSERRELRRQKRTDGIVSLRWRQRLKIATLSISIFLLVAAGIIAIARYAANQPPLTEADIVSRSGLHWHPEIAIYIKGMKQDVPAAIGLGLVHQPVHTHEADGVVHLEFSSLVKKDDLTVGQFFNNWGKPFSRERVLDYTNGPDGTVKMYVNEEPNDAFEHYVMQDNDRIEIRYD